MTAAFLVDADDLSTWAQRQDAQGDLPKWVGRLVLATAHDISTFAFRSGKGVNLGGWDGIVEAGPGNAFVPNGVSGWELSVAQDVTRKAESDYRKRCADPQGIDPPHASFVFVTANRWSGKEAWLEKVRTENRWHDVRAYDADDLAFWLETAPAIHISLSSCLGKTTDGADDIESCWNNWSAATRPAITTKLVLAGRQQVIDTIHQGLINTETPLRLRAESRVEALAVLMASVLSLKLREREDILARCVVVHQLAAWKDLCRSSNRLILVQNFESSDTIGRAMTNGHTAVVLIGREDNESANAEKIPRLSREEAGKALCDMGVASHQVTSLSAIARSSLKTLRRRLAIVPELERPKWARPENARSLLPALLAGRWSADTEGDRAALATLAGADYDAIGSVVLRWSHEDDSPVQCTGSTWYLTDEEDVWDLLGRSLVREDLDRFLRLAVDILGEGHASFDLPEDQRWMAGVVGPRPTYSDVLRIGIANTLAILGARCESIQTTDDSNVALWARRAVEEILATADWKVWASLPLKSLAEAAPDAFLSAVDRALKGDNPTLAELFRDANGGLFSGSSPHVGLLWALETLAWSKEHLLRASSVLAELAKLDPGGKTANRPLRSLRMIFLPWSPQTSASSRGRLAAIDDIRRRVPAIAWKLMKAMLPQHLDSAFPTSRPRWREWAPDEVIPMTGVPYFNAVHELVTRMLEDVGGEDAPWSDLIEALPELPPEDYQAVASRLERVEPDKLEPIDLAVIWNGLRTLVSQCRSYRNAKHLLPEEEVRRLENVLPRVEPRQPIDRYGWLFANNPALPEGGEEDRETYGRTLAERQCEAIDTLTAANALEWLSRFVQDVERPDLLGYAFARCGVAETVDNELLGEYVSPPKSRRHQFIASFVQVMVSEIGLDWATERLKTFGTKWSASQRAAFCTCLPFNASTWDIVGNLDRIAIEGYWESVEPFYADESEIETAVQRLLEHERPEVAAELLHRHVASPGLSASLIADVLEALLQSPASETDRQRLSAGDLSDLLQVVSSSKDIEESLIARLEWALSPALGRHQYTPKLLYREFVRSPEFFAQVVSLVYRAEGEEPHELSDNEKAQWKRAYELLHSWRWRPLPGMPEEGGFDCKALCGWVLDAREHLRDGGRLGMGDYTIGEVLSCTPAGEDGVWPHSCIRDLIEELESDEFERGLVFGLLNSEGVTCRSPGEGGKRERKTAQHYDKWADIVVECWGRTAAMYRAIRDHYRTRAHYADQRAERDELLDR